MASVSVDSEDKGIKKTNSLYELVPGISTSSNAIQCAYTAGVDEDTLKRAAQVLQDGQSRRQITVPSARPTPKTLAIQEAFYNLTEQFMSEENWKECAREKIDELIHVARSIDALR
ncbi:hypothetical protein H310_01416 [Aphanomyces invadans]|uniref:Uncharacterized protein n=1 Tax=Aphanomyces invadans TaxID=157072 RepID=A0A024URN4_9STRA|nr:hypothetical protein H310_01416 [Aphanomyces invadans]ETW08934.1 hypothetical protein H310_01416 [Aphanomyces invadans]|eukprot:XP_008862739.1 hypothetical protein H310_01416 [Aphanomyces invadans]